VHDPQVRSKAVPTVEDALAMALEHAAAAERWDIVGQLARELEARRLAAAGVPSVTDRRERPRR
jgi:hypothetical protein